MRTDELEKKLKNAQNLSLWRAYVEAGGTAIITGLVDAGVRRIMAAAHPVPHAAAQPAASETKNEANGEMAASNCPPASDVHTNNTPQNLQQTSQVACPNPMPQQSDLTPRATGNARSAPFIAYSESHSKVVESSQKCIYYGGSSK